MPILVTAFGPFGGRIGNASSLAVKELRKTFPGIGTRILPADAVVAPSRLRQAIREIQPSALIMLGEAAGSTGIRFETTAWNLKEFGIPDNAGRKPLWMPVRKGGPEFLLSTLPLEALRTRLTDLDPAVALSDDPGRYLCNQLFFTGLDFLKTNALAIPAGFIHLPLEDVCPTEVSVRVISEVLGQLTGGGEIHRP